MDKMNIKNFGLELNAIKTLFPGLNAAEVKDFLFKRELENTKKYSVTNSVSLLKAFKNDRINEEVEYLLNCIENLRNQNIVEEVDIAYEDYRRGEMDPKEFIFMRDFLPMNEQDFFTLKWSLKKVNKIIREDSINKNFFSISQMNIDKDHVDEDYLSTAIHNKTPAIVGTYRPLKPYFEDTLFYTILDGNHRVVAKQKSKGVTEYPTYLLNDIETFRGLRHPFYAAYYLIHLLIALFWNYPNQSNAIVEQNLNYYFEFKKEFFM